MIDLIYDQTENAIGLRYVGIIPCLPEVRQAADSLTGTLAL